MKKRVLWMSLLTFLLLFCPVRAEAAQEASLTEEVLDHVETVGQAEAVHVDENTRFILSATADLEEVSSNEIDMSLDGAATEDTGLFKTQLRDKQLEIYQALNTAGINAQKNGASITIRNKENLPYRDIWNAYLKIYQYAAYAFQRDHMDKVIWGTNAVRIGLSGTTKKLEITVSFTLNDNYSASIGRQVNAKIDQLVRSCPATTVYDKVKYYHDWLVDHNDYDSAVSGLSKDDGSREYYYAHSPVGCLLNGRGVCESYTKAFKLFCMREKIPCVIVTGSGHAWNYVKMPDKRWYMVDCTWDDPVGGNGSVYYDYFLVSNAPNIKGHIEDDGLVYPETYTEEYDASSHEHMYQAEITKAADCLETGMITFTCACGYICTEKLARKPENHTYDAGSITKAATETSEGIKTYTCLVCGGRKTESLPKLPITFQKISPMLDNRTEGIRIRWTKEAKAAGYYIFRKTGSAGYKKIKTIRGNAALSYTDSSVKTANGRAYTYAVCAYKESRKGLLVGKTITRLSSCSIRSLKNSAKASMKLVWKKNSKASGYEITYSASASFAAGNKKVLIKKGNAESVTLKKLKKGKKYYVRIRAYKKVGSTSYYSCYSAKKSVKIGK